MYSLREKREKNRLFIPVNLTNLLVITFIIYFVPGSVSGMLQTLLDFIKSKPSSLEKFTSISFTLPNSPTG